jgi:hypothetical protein
VNPKVYRLTDFHQDLIDQFRVAFPTSELASKYKFLTPLKAKKDNPKPLSSGTTFLPRILGPSARKPSE